MPRGARVTDVEAACGQTGYSRFPVVGDDGELVGYLHIKDVLQADPHGRARVVEDKWIRPFADVRARRHAGQRAADAPGQGRPHGAASSTTTGTVVGVVTLEDVIEELVGEIRDAAHADGH